jgi:hypothetical protein
MATSPGTAVAFVMQNMHAVLRAYPDFGARLQGEVQAIEDTATTYPENCIALAKKLVETCCKTILHECGETVSGTEDLQPLFKCTLEKLTFFVPDHPDNQRIRDSVRQAGHSLRSAIQAIAEIRNVQGVDHGAPADWPSLLPAHAAFVAVTVDALSALLLETYRSESAARKTPLHYEDNPDFNDYIDDVHPEVEVLNLVFTASEVLFEMDPEYYETALNEFRASPPTEESEGGEAEAVSQ